MLEVVYKTPEPVPTKVVITCTEREAVIIKAMAGRNGRDMCIKWAADANMFRKFGDHPVTLDEVSEFSANLYWAIKRD